MSAYNDVLPVLEKVISESDPKLSYRPHDIHAGFGIDCVQRFESEGSRCF